MGPGLPFTGLVTGRRGRRQEWEGRKETGLGRQEWRYRENRGEMKNGKERMRDRQGGRGRRDEQWEGRGDGQKRRERYRREEKRETGRENQINDGHIKH